MSSASEPERNTSVPRSLSFGVMDLAAPLRWPMQAMQGSLDLPLVPPGPSRPAVPPLNLDAAKLVASDGPNSSSTHRLKTQSSRLSRRLKLEAQRPNPNPACLFSCTSISSHNDVLAETGRFTVTPFVGMKRLLLPAPGPKLMGAPVQAGDELAKMLGESALLADLGPLLRLKQEMEVQEAVEKRSVSSNASASGSDAQQTTASLANRIASQESLISGFTATPRDTQVTARRPAPFRRLRLHACLVLEGLCQAIPSRSPGFFEVPVEDIFEMLQSSCSRAGACSFNLDEQPEPVPSQASKVLELHLSAARVAKLQHFAARLWLCNSSQRCVCGGDSGRIDDACSPCTCVDDATASCLWQLLAEHARQVDTKVAKCVTTPSCPSKEEVQEVCFDHAPSGGHQDGAEDPEDLLGKKWQWHRRLGLDSFLKLVAASLRQAISQLKGAQRAGTAGPDVIMSLQHRLSATLRLASRYLRPPAALPYGVPLTPQRLLLAQQVLSAPLTALKA
ncbi:unnamed protein product [Durusdinium trenchii]|uniref:Uncharacterized protein n=1 Tax=Durusdinium trenchii TaxID=1381693 RepID=A0ABP0MRS6_9DINO